MSMDEPAVDERRWLACYRETIGPLWTYVARRTAGDRALCEDVVQEAWLRALGAWAGRGVPRDPLAWLRTTARNLLANHHRRRGPVAASAEIERALAPAGDGPPPSADAVAALHLALDRLRRGPARLIEAFHLEGRDVASIARELGVSERAVEGRLRRARSALRRALAPYLETR